MKKYALLPLSVAALLIITAAYVFAPPATDPVDAFRHAITPYRENSEIPTAVFSEFYDSVGPDRMLEVLDERPACHLESHNLGRLIYSRTHNLPYTVGTCLNQCYGGCVHGALLGFVEEERKTTGVTGDPRAEDLTPSLLQKVAALCDTDSITRYTGVTNCYHALGHVFASFTDSDVEQTLELCRTLHSKGDGAVFHCAAGLYMQRETDYADADMHAGTTLWYPCDVSDYPAACYRYRILTSYSSSTSIEDTLRECRALSEPDRSACIHGLAVAAAFDVLREPASINLLCTNTDAVAERMCLDGVVGRLTSYGIHAANTICSVYTEMSKSDCMKSEQSIYSMRRDYRTYLVTR